MSIWQTILAAYVGGVIGIGLGLAVSAHSFKPAIVGFIWPFFVLLGAWMLIKEWGRRFINCIKR